MGWLLPAIPALPTGSKCWPGTVAAPAPHACSCLYPLQLGEALKSLHGNDGAQWSPVLSRDPFWAQAHKPSCHLAMISLAAPRPMSPLAPSSQSWGQKGSSSCSVGRHWGQEQELLQDGCWAGGRCHAVPLRPLAKLVHRDTACPQASPSAPWEPSPGWRCGPHPPSAPQGQGSGARRGDGQGCGHGWAPAPCTSLGKRECGYADLRMQRSSRCLLPPLPRPASALAGCPGPWMQSLHLNDID